ncbi:MAG: transposase [Balneolaceae bacterium]|nr:transposase [Balneolaceae bacterium]
MPGGPPWTGTRSTSKPSTSSAEPAADFHSELKGELDLERLPSGKVAANQHILDLGMIAYNILRLLGQQMLATGQVQGRKGESARLRLRTVLNSLIYMAGRLVRHARRKILRIFEGHGWADVALSLARAP